MAENNQIIETFDEDGNKVSFELIDIVSVDDIEYALLLPSEKQEDMEDDEILVMRLKKDGDEYIFEVIDDDSEFEKIVQYIEEIEDETEE